MATYYETLKVSRKASSNEIKSAYRRLARKLHPDRNNGSEETARAFAAIAEAYEVLGNAKEREKYDRKLLQAQFSIADGDSSFLTSSNSHARRWRRMVYEHRYKEIIDRMIADERRETWMRQKAIFPAVALFVSSLLVGIAKPRFFSDSAIIGKIIMATLFVVGLIHLYRRLREALDRFTFNPDDLHDSILDDGDPVIRPYSRAAVLTFLALGFCIFLGAGILIGSGLSLSSTQFPSLFSPTLGLEILFYPPIFVLIADIAHSFAFRVD